VWITCSPDRQSVTQHPQLSSVSDREGRFVWVVQPIGSGSGEADRQVEWWFVVTAADRMAGGFIIVEETDRSKSYYLTTIIAPNNFPPAHAQQLCSHITVCSNPYDNQSKG
jgi:hypothetical protein